MTYNVFENETNKFLIDATTTDNVKYIGVAKCGTATNAPYWKIIKETLDDDGNVTSSVTYKTFAKWTDRATLEY